MKSLIKIIAVLACLAAAVPSLHAQTPEARQAVIDQLIEMGVTDLDEVTAEQVADAVAALAAEDPDEAENYAASGIQLLPIPQQAAGAVTIVERASAAAPTRAAAIAGAAATQVNSAAPAIAAAAVRGVGSSGTTGSSNAQIISAVTTSVPSAGQEIADSVNDEADTDTDTDTEIIEVIDDEEIIETENPSVSTTDQ